jgi:hypothetical protein
VAKEIEDQKKTDDKKSPRNRSEEANQEDMAHRKPDLIRTCLK